MGAEGTPEEGWQSVKRKERATAGGCQEEGEGRREQLVKKGVTERE